MSDDEEQRRMSLMTDFCFCSANILMESMNEHSLHSFIDFVESFQCVSLGTVFDQRKCVCVSVCACPFQCVIVVSSTMMLTNFPCHYGQQMGEFVNHDKQYADESDK